jgi:formylmethanofuran dehydrogenase subunit C
MKTRWYGFLLAGLLGPASALADGGTILVSGGRGGSYMDGGTIVVSGGRGGSYMEGGTIVVSGG